MCGITGIFLTGASQPRLDEAILDRMTDSLAHRGPDDRGIHLDRRAGVGLGHRRLSIIDLSALGHQPMSNDDGSTWIVFNGEIYNHAALRSELEAEGARFRSRCDTEVILRLYDKMGDACVERLDGMFAFAIWDGRRQRLFLARDRIGVKPLYWAHVQDHFLFGSEARAVLEHPLVARTVSEESLWHNLTFLSTPAPTTLFRDVRKLSAGHHMSVDRNGVRIEQWWSALDAPQLTPEECGFDHASRQIRERLAASVKARMMSDVPFGVFLSGGIDSSANVALMAACSDTPINTFTVGYAGAGVGHLNELDQARLVAERYRTNHHEISIDHRSLLECMPVMVEHMDDPVLDPVCVPLYFISKLARQNGVKVVQVGEGSDELFIGYNTYLQSIRFARRLAFLRNMPAGVRRAVKRTAIPALHRLNRGGLGRAHDWAELLRRAIDEDVFWGGAIALVDADKSELMPSGVGQFSSWSVIEKFHQEIERRWPDADRAQRMTFVELGQRLPELLLGRVDRITMSVSIEGREPFLDHRLVEFALRLPQDVKIRGGRSKAVLKHAVADLLPEELLHRPKQGFPAPVGIWVFEDEFGRVLRETILTSPLIKEGWLDRAGVSHLLDEHFSHRHPRGGVLWTLFCLALWYRRWVLGEKSFAG